MTENGEKIPDISVERLQEQLAREKDDAKAVKRLFVAIEYKKGRSPAEIEERYGIPRQTVYNWLDRFEAGTVHKTIYDEHRSGRSRKLNDKNLSILENLLEEGAESHGFIGQIWTGQRVAGVVEQEFGVSISERTALRYLKELGWSNKKPKRVAVERDKENIEQFRNEEWKKIRDTAQRENRMIVFVDETKFRLLPTFLYTWAPKGEEATVESQSTFDYIAVIGALTYIPETQEFSLQYDTQRYNFNAESILPFLCDITSNSVRNPIFLLDNWEPHKAAVKELHEEYADTPTDIQVEYFPEYASDLNPADRVWGLAKNAELPNYAPKSLDKLEKEIASAFGNIRTDETKLRYCVKNAGLEIEA